VFVWESDGIQVFSKLNFIYTQFVKRDVKLLGRKLYSPSLKDAAWLKDADFFFDCPYICQFGWVDEVLWKKKYRQVYGKREKLTDRLRIVYHSRGAGRIRYVNRAKVLCSSITVRGTPWRVYYQKNLVGVCGPIPKTLTLFMTKICDFCYPIYDLTKNSIPY